MTPSGIEPATCRFVAQCLNHYATVTIVVPSFPKVKQYKSAQVEMIDPKDEGTMNVRKVRIYQTIKLQCLTRLEYPAKPL